MKLEEINSLIQLEEANLAQLPKTAEEKKKEMTTKYNELMAVRKMGPRLIYFGFWCLMTNTTKFD